MGDTLLNQDEIQDLLKNHKAQGQATGLWEGQTVNYDFLGAALKKDEKIRVVNKIHETAAKFMSNAMSELCDSEISIELVKHEMASASDLLVRINFENLLIYQWYDDQAGTEGLFEFDRNLFFNLFNIYYGGTRDYIKKGKLTSLEEGFFARALSPIIESLQHAWQGSGNWRFPLKKILEQQEDLTGLGWSFDCIFAIFKITFKETEIGQFNVLFPKEVLSNIGGVEEEEGTKKVVQDKHWILAVKRAISHKLLRFNVTLGTLKLPINQVLKLKSGDSYSLVIPKKGHRVFLDGLPTFRASIGAVDGKRAVKIIGRDQGEEHG